MSSQPTFRLLGPLEVEGADPNALGGPKQRAMLAYLLLHPGAIVSTDELVDAVWGDEPPATASAIVHGYVRRIRELIAPTPAALRSQVGGYRLDVPGEAADASVFTRLSADGLAAGRDGRPAEANGLLVQALALWRGEPLAGLGELPFLTAFRARLEGVRLATQLGSIDARLALGQARELIPELQALVRDLPEDETVTRLFMLALYRSGGQAEALAAYRDLRRRLAENLGIAPAPSVQALEAAILRQDPSLELPARTTAPRSMVPVPPPARRLRDARPTDLRAAIAGLVVVAIAAGAIAMAGLGRSPAGAPSSTGGASGIALEASGLWSVLASTGASPIARPPLADVIASWPMALPSCCGIGSSTAWGVGHHDDRLRAIDLATNHLTDLGEVAGFQSSIPEPIAGSVWIPSAQGPLVRFDPVARRVVSQVPVSSADVAFGFRDVWATTLDHHLDRIDLATNEVIAAIAVGSGQNDWTDGLAISSGAVWDSNGDDAVLLKVDPASNRIVDRIRGFGTSDSGAPIAYGEGSIWLLRAVGPQMTLFRVDVGSDRIVAEIPIGPPLGGNTGTVAVGGGYAWTVTWDGTLSQVDPRTNTVVRVRSLPAIPQNISFGDGSLWVDAYDAEMVWRIDPSH